MSSASVDVPELGRAARLEARVSSAQKALLQRAAALSGRSLSEFVVASAQEAALRVIEAHESIQLSKAQQTAFVKSLLDPPVASARLQQAAARYRKQLGL